MKAKKMNFFKRLKTAIFNLDEYSSFIDEKFSVSVKYILIIIAIMSVVLSIITTVSVSNKIKKGITYFENEFPDFFFDEYSLVLNEYVEGYDKEYDVKIIADATKDLSNEKINEYIRKTKDSRNAFIVLNDKIIYRAFDMQTEYTYKELNSFLGLEDLTKQGIIDEYKEVGGVSTIMGVGIIFTTFVLFIENLIEIVVYSLLVAFVGIIIGRLCGVAMKYPVAITLAIYSLTVPIICRFIYTIVYEFTGFEIKNFDTMYLIIAYVYIIAAILIIKTDLMKQSQDLMRIKSVEEQLKDELKKKELEEKEQKDKEEKDEDENSKEKNEDEKKSNKKKNKAPDIEPDGSEI